MNTTKELYMHLALNKKIYLPTYQLEKAMELLKSVKSPFAGLNLVENEASFKQYKDVNKGAYVIDGDDYLADKRRAVVRIDSEGNEEDFASLYEAAGACGVPKGFGNISKAIKKNGTAYGYAWRYKTTKNK